MSGKDGGSAFPIAEQFDDLRGEYIHLGSEGMTLRDYFAAKAMQGIVAGVISLGQNTEKEHTEQFAVAAYMQADAMLKAREA